MLRRHAEIKCENYRSFRQHPLHATTTKIKILLKQGGELVDMMLHMRHYTTAKRINIRQPQNEPTSCKPISELNRSSTAVRAIQAWNIVQVRRITFTWLVFDIGKQRNNSTCSGVWKTIFIRMYAAWNTKTQMLIMILACGKYVHSHYPGTP